MLLAAILIYYVDGLYGYQWNSQVILNSPPNHSAISM